MIGTLSTLLCIFGGLYRDETTVMTHQSKLIPTLLIACLCDKWGYKECNSFYSIDVDECRLGSFKCHGRAACTNVAGSYTCRCLPGYTGDGVVNCESKSHFPPYFIFCASLTARCQFNDVYYSFHPHSTFPHGR